MTTYSTGNPLGSSDPRDLYDNAENLDNFVNGAQPAYDDRLGRSRRSWQSVEDQAAQQEVEFNAGQTRREDEFQDDQTRREGEFQDDQTRREDEFQDDQTRREDEFDTAQAGRSAQFTQLMISGGYEPLGDYAAGIEVTTYKQVIKEGSEFWRAAAGTTLPYTTTGGGMPEGGAFVNIGDGLLRQDLVQPVATFNNVADMVASGGLDVGRKVRTLGYYTPGDGGGCDYEIVAAGTGSNYGFLYEQLSGSGLEAKLLGGGIMEDKTAYIPTDYATLQEAVDDTSKIRPKQGVTIVLMIESGHRLASGLVLRGGDYNHYRIESADELVEVENETLSTTGFRQDVRPVFGALSGCVFPVVAIKLDLRPYLSPTGQANGSGFLCVQGSTMLIESTGGCLGGQLGAIAYDGGVLNCPGADFRFSREAGITAWSNSKIYASGADASFSEMYGVRSTEGASLVFTNGKATDCARHASRAVASALLDVTSADLRRSATKGVYARHACVVMANFVDVSECLEDGVFSQRGSTVTCIESTADNCGIGFRCEDSSVICAPLSSAQNCTTAFTASQESSVLVTNLNAAGCTNVGMVEDNSSAVARFLSCDGSSTGLIVLNGSKAVCDFATITNSGESAIRAFYGATVVCRDGVFTGAVGNSLYTIGGYINAAGADTSNSRRGFVAETGKIDASSGVANNCTDGVYAFGGSEIVFGSGEATGCTRGVYVQGSRAIVRDADLSGCIGQGIRVEVCSEVTLRNTNCRKGASDASDDIQCRSGSLIRSSNNTGGTNIPLNTPQSDGMILGA